MTRRNNHLEGAEHGRSIASMFNGIASWYDLLNRTLSFGLDRRWRQRLVHAVKPGPCNRILDLASGTMDVSGQLQDLQEGAKILAFDFSLAMLKQGRTKIDPRQVFPVCADAHHIPLPDHSVDCVTIAFGIRNILPRASAYAEIFRILIPGGRLCILEFGSARQKIWAGLYNLYLRRILPAIGRLVSRDPSAYRYLATTITQFPPAEELRQELLAAGFRTVRYQALTSGIVYLHIADT